MIHVIFNKRSQLYLALENEYDLQMFEFLSKETTRFIENFSSSPWGIIGPRDFW